MGYPLLLRLDGLQPMSVSVSLLAVLASKTQVLVELVLLTKPPVSLPLKLQRELAWVAYASLQNSHIPVLPVLQLLVDSRLLLSWE